MCYSAQCWANWRKYQREFNSKISIADFAALYGYKRRAAGVRTTKAMDAAFLDPQTPEEAEVAAIVRELARAEELKQTQDLFAQKKRLAEAQRKLDTKPTKKAEADVRIASDKIPAIERRLDDLRRAEPKDRDSRMYPFWWVPVMVMEADGLVVKPMRYHCRLPGWSPKMERGYGTYNARRDSFGKTWQPLFGRQHGVMVVNRFYENVDRDGENLVLEFNPQPAHDMLVACLWNRSRGWDDEPEDFYSFAAITDEPPAEVAAAGHDRCIVPIKRENMMAWLQPDPARLNDLQGILEDRDRPYYEHREAA